jgi:hypothetical protein
MTLLAGSISYADKTFMDPQGQYTLKYPDKFEFSYDQNTRVARIIDPTTANFYIFSGNKIKELESIKEEIQYADLLKVEPTIEDEFLKEFKSFEALGYKLLGKGEYKFGSTRGMVYDYSNPDGFEIRVVIFIKKHTLYVSAMFAKTEYYDNADKQLKAFLNTMSYK